MTDIALASPMGDDAAPVQPASRPNLDKGFNPLTMILFFGILAAGLLYVAYSIYADIDATGMRVTAYLPYILLFVALLIALGFEFVNGFHDTANAVATVIYTHSLPAEFAVMWSGFFNFLGVLLSSGAVAFGIVSLLPVELILQVGSSAGFAMVFALLIAAIIWNLGTWYFGLPASSSHTLIGSIIDGGSANALMRGRDGTSGVDWTKATEIGYALLLSPLFGFIMAAILLLVLKFIVRNPALYAAPEGNKPPPLWIRGILIATCTGVSFAHGSNDGQKGIGPDHADPDRHRADRLRAEPRAAGIPGGAVPEDLGSRFQGGRRQGRRPQHHRRSPARGDAICRSPPDHRRHLSLAGRAGEGRRRPGAEIRLAQQGARRSRRQHP